MAQQLNTGDEGESEFQFERWIKDNDLHDIRHLLVKHKMISPETLNKTSQEFVHLMTDPDFLVTAHITMAKLLRGIQRIGIKANVIRIYISKEEEEAADELDKYDENLFNLKKEISECNDSLTQNVKECNQNIEISFNRLLQKVNAKKQEITMRLKAIEAHKRAQIDAKSHIIHEEETKVNNTKKKCGELQEDPQMDRNKRKYAIVSMINDCLNAKLERNAAKIESKIIFEFDVDKIISMIDEDLIRIYDAGKHPIPVIADIESKSITRNAANIHFTAKLKKEDKTKKISSHLFIGLESVHAENDHENKEDREEIQERIKFEKNREKYVIQLKKLTKNTKYTMSFNLYEAENKLNIDPNIIKFKTKDDDIFIYQTDLDENGIIYAIGSNFGQQQFSNPSTQKLIKITSSKWCYGEVTQILGRRKDPFQCFSDYHVANPWIIIDFGAKYKIKPTHYTLRHSLDYDCFLRHWNLEASNDGKDWVLLKQHKNDESIKQTFASKSWSVKCNEKYQIFRILMTGKHSDNYWHLMCSAFEIYGDLIGSS